MVRRPAVAGQFYPADAGRLKAEVLSYLKENLPRRKALAVISPHAGYMYSGGVAGQVFSRVEIPGDVIIIGPNHRGIGAAQSVMASGTWAMPMGNIEINPVLASKIMKHSLQLKDDAEAHRYEHSLEVQVPFIQALRPEFKLVPIALSISSFRECRELGAAIAHGIKEYGQQVLIVASTDMTHYESHQKAVQKDKMAIDKILEMDPEGLLKTVFGQGISMCGVAPTAVALTACLEQGARSAELVAYSTSGETSGDYNQVVGYAGLIIS
jgi:AmmeMemoRadiSam system protein B